MTCLQQWITAQQASYQATLSALVGVELACQPSMRVVVTGATGNIGTSVVQSLARRAEVQSIVGVARRPPERSLPKSTFVCCDIAQDDLTGVLAGADAVVHLAWQIQPSREQRRLFRVNVLGSRRVFEATAKAGAAQLVFASSVGAYSPGPKDRFVDESWPTGGVPTSMYSQQKAQVESIADELTLRYSLKIARMRPALVFKREAASEIRRLFFGRLLPRALYAPRWIPVVPRHERLRFQAVHSRDVGEAFASAVTRRVEGAFNLAAEPVLDGDELARALDARAVQVSPKLLRAGAALTYRLRLQPADPGWIDMATSVPLMTSARAREELGWEPQRSASDTLLELFEGIRGYAGAPTPPLHAE